MTQVINETLRLQRLQIGFPFPWNKYDLLELLNKLSLYAYLYKQEKMEMIKRATKMEGKKVKKKFWRLKTWSAILE